MPANEIEEESLGENQEDVVLKMYEAWIEESLGTLESSVERQFRSNGIDLPEAGIRGNRGLAFFQWSEEISKDNTPAAFSHCSPEVVQHKLAPLCYYGSLVDSARFSFEMSKYPPERTAVERTAALAQLASLLAAMDLSDILRGFKSLSSARKGGRERARLGRGERLRRDSLIRVEAKKLCEKGHSQRSIARRLSRSFPLSEERIRSIIRKPT